MLRRQFLAGAIAVTSVALLPSVASAKRGGGFRFFSKSDSPSTRRTKMWIYGTGGAFVGLVAIGRAVFWVMNRLEQNPAPRPRYDLPPPVVPIAQPSVQSSASPTTTVRNTALASSFGRRRG